jgi:cytoskeletal protein CcmA (bactofilin family)
MFSKKPPEQNGAAPRPYAAEPMAAPRNPNGGSTFSVLGADIVITGDVKAGADLHIDGRVEGDIDCASLVQGEGSEIAGAIRADNARLAGTVRGSIDAGSLTILKSARIHGDVSYDALTIEQGAQVDGRFAHRTGTSAASAPVEAPATTPDSDGDSDDDTARFSLVS